MRIDDEPGNEFTNKLFFELQTEARVLQSSLRKLQSEGKCYEIRMMLNHEMKLTFSFVSASDC